MATTTPTKENNFSTGATGENAPGFRGADYYSNTAKSTAAVLPPIVQPNTTLTSTNLAPVAQSVLPDAPVSTYGGLQGSLEALTGQAKARSAEEIARDEAGARKDSSLDKYMQEIIGQGSISSSVDRTAQDNAKRESDKYTAMLEAEQLAQRRREEAFKTNFTGTTAGASAGLDKLSRDSLSKQADIAILQTAANRDYDTAASIADRTVALKMEQSNANLAALKFFYDENKSSFNKADDRIYAEVLAKKEAENRRLERNETAIAQLKLNVAQYGGGAALLSKLSAIDTTKADAYDKAIAIAGKYAQDPLDRAIKNAQLNKLNKETADAPTIKSINGVDMQWNGSAWIPAKVAGADGSDINNPKVYQEKINQFNSLINTANEAVELKKGAGNSGIKRAFNKTFVGSSKETQLQALTDTLKTNLLTLKGDPNLKKFFGPQMSDNDTRLMLSASSPIDVKSMQPDQVESYIKEISGFLERKKKEISDDYSQRMAEQYIDGVSGLMTAQSITNLYPDPKKK